MSIRHKTAADCRATRSRSRRLRLETLEDRRLLSLAAAAPLAAAKSQTLADLAPDEQAAVSAAIGRDQLAYHAQAAAQGAVLANAANGFSAQLHAGVLDVTAGSDHWSTTLASLGYGNALQSVGTPSVASADNRVDCRYAGVDAWYVNGPGGLGQGALH